MSPAWSGRQPADAIAAMTTTEALAWLEKRGTRANRDGMARYGIVARKAFGVPMRTLLILRRKIGIDHDLALALWKTGWYEARLLAALIGDPVRLTRREMNAWATTFENWADCDTACFHLFDRSPLAGEMILRWAPSSKLFVRRAAFALIASIALHDKSAGDREFRRYLPVIGKGAGDEADLVRKGVSWALRAIGGRSVDLHAASVALARRLAGSGDSARRWVGKDVLRDLERPLVKARVARKQKAIAGKGTTAR
jgi:3-methyladenine DNA glycosylase AlkD